VVDLWVFDFDGTPPETAAKKRATFFEVFPNARSGVVEVVLLQWLDASRHEVIPRMATLANDPTLEQAAACGTAVAQCVQQAPAVELPRMLWPGQLNKGSLACCQ